MITGVVLALLVTAPAPVARKKPCTREEASQAEDSASSLASWAAVEKSFQRFGHCDDGAIAEGYSDTVVKLLGRKWAEFPELRRLAAADRKFHDFVLGHIDATTGRDDLEAAVHNATTRCPRDARALCGEIVVRARDALREIGAPRK